MWGLLCTPSAAPQTTLYPVEDTMLSNPTPNGYSSQYTDVVKVVQQHTTKYIQGKVKYEEYFINITTECLDSGRGTYLTDGIQTYTSEVFPSLWHRPRLIKCIQKRLHL